MGATAVAPDRERLVYPPTTVFVATSMMLRLFESMDGTYRSLSTGSNAGVPAVATDRNLRDDEVGGEQDHRDVGDVRGQERGGPFVGNEELVHARDIERSRRARPESGGDILEDLPRRARDDAHVVGDSQVAAVLGDVDVVRRGDVQRVVRVAVRAGLEVLDDPVRRTVDHSQVRAVRDEVDEAVRRVKDGVVAAGVRGERDGGDQPIVRTRPGVRARDDEKGVERDFRALRDARGDRAHPEGGDTEADHREHEGARFDAPIPAVGGRHGPSRGAAEKNLWSLSAPTAGRPPPGLPHRAPLARGRGLRAVRVGRGGTGRSSGGDPSPRRSPSCAESPLGIPRVVGCGSTSFATCPVRCTRNWLRSGWATGILRRIVSSSDGSSASAILPRSTLPCTPWTGDRSSREWSPSDFRFPADAVARPSWGSPTSSRVRRGWDAGSPERCLRRSTAARSPPGGAGRSSGRTGVGARTGLYESLGYEDVYSPPNAIGWDHVRRARKPPTGYEFPRETATNGVRLERILRSATRGRLGFVPRPAGSLRTRLALGWRKAGSHRVLSKGSQSVGYAHFSDDSLWNLTANEVVVDSPGAP